MKYSQKGFSFLELMIVLVIAAMLAVFAIPMFGGPGIDCKNTDSKGKAKISYTTRAKLAAAKGEIGSIFLKADMFDLNNNRPPTSLAEMGMAETVDPWGNPYVFLSFEGVNGNGPKRKDHNMVPVNSYFDIYSMGPDGKTATPFTSIPGQDDIVSAGNGQYLGIACDYYQKKK